MTDPISDMLTRIRNASQAGHSEVLVPLSKIKKSIAELLKKNNLLENVFEGQSGTRKNLRLVLRYIKDEKGRKNSCIHGIRRVSRQGQRRYAKKNEIPFVRNGFGIAVMSTSSGLMTDSQARKARLGGEIICEIW